jgi:predicted ATPase/DNA-binding winged helix-turn-helix (wHTH) protein
MLPEYALRFGPYRLDASNERLQRGNQVVRLTGKAFAVLCYLLGRPGQLVTREELFRAVWPETVVSDAALTTCIKEIRKALKDQTKTPQYIETVHRRGFRFIARLAPASQPAQSPRSKGQNLQSQPAPSPQHPTHSFVGREAELARLHGWFERALAGERQFVFITGEPGIGKTVVIEMFLNQIVTKEQLRVGRGQCVEQYGAGEAYLPVLEALGRLCRELHGQHLIQLLDQYAPTWLIQMPTLLRANELDALHRKTAGMTQQRMFREMAETLEAFTAEHPLILVLEDLHWSDYSTLELLAFLARRREAARLLVMSTYRPVEVLTHEHPLKGVKQELSLHGQCEELPLDFLTEAAVEEYLTARFDFGVQHAEPWRNLARLIHQHTDGNPLFMVNVTNHFVNQEVITTVAGEWKLRDGFEDVEVGVPESLRQLIEQQIGQVRTEERAVLEAASVAGVEFPAAAVATGIGMEEEAVEEVCEALVRRGQLLRSTGTTEWPDGILSARYGFIHTLYQLDFIHWRYFESRATGL